MLDNGEFMVKCRGGERKRNQSMDKKVAGGQFMGEGAKGRPVYSDIGGSRFPINIVNKLIGLNRNGEIKKVNTAAPYLHSELDGWIQAIHESNNLWYEFFGSLSNTENIVDLATPAGDMVEEGMAGLE